MKPIKIVRYGTVLWVLVLTLQSCFQPSVEARGWFHPVKAVRTWMHPVKLVQKEPSFNIPQTYPSQSTPSEMGHPDANDALLSWQSFFADPYLTALIETALVNNQALNIFMQDIEIAKNEVNEKKGEYLPKVGLGFGASKYRVSKHTQEGMIDRSLEANELKPRYSELNLGTTLTWEVDVWRKLRNAKDAASMRLVAKYEGKNLLTSRLVSEIARTYYELMALDNVLKILDENIEIQTKAFLKMQLLKQYAKSNNLAVNRFEAQLLKTKAQKFEMAQNIVEKENRLRFLSGMYEDKPILRASDKLMAMPVDPLQVGVPTQLLANRPDIRQAEYAIKAAKLDLKSVRASLYPNVSISASSAFSAFDPTFLLNPQSFVYNLVGDLVAPLLNRKAILAHIATADAYQTQAVLDYEQTLLQAYTEVLNQVSKINNIQQSFETKQKEVSLLDESVVIANNLFQYAKADYVEVLLTQEEKLNAEKELVEIKMNLLGSKIDLYRALGGGWR